MCSWGKSHSEQQMGRLPSPEMRLRQIVPFAKSKMGVVFRLHTGQKKSKALGQFLLLQAREGPYL